MKIDVDNYISTLRSRALLSYHARLVRELRRMENLFLIDKLTEGNIANYLNRWRYTLLEDAFELKKGKKRELIIFNDLSVIIKNKCEILYESYHENITLQDLCLFKTLKQAQDIYDHKIDYNDTTYESREFKWLQTYVIDSQRYRIAK